MSDERRPPRASRRASSRATTIKVTLVSLTAAAALTGGLAAQMASGRDPALGSPQKTGEPQAKRDVTTSAQPTDSQPAAPPPAAVVTSSS